MESVERLYFVGHPRVGVKGLGRLYFVEHPSVGRKGGREAIFRRIP